MHLHHVSYSIFAETMNRSKTAKRNYWQLKGGQRREMIERVIKEYVFDHRGSKRDWAANTLIIKAQIDYGLYV